MPDQQAAPTGTLRQILVKPPERANMPPALAANFFQFSWSNVEVLMTTSFVDGTPSGPDKQNDAAQAEIISRHMMSIGGFALLYAQVNEAAAALKALGIPLDEIVQASVVPSAK